MWTNFTTCAILAVSSAAWNVSTRGSFGGLYQRPISRRARPSIPYRQPSRPMGLPYRRPGRPLAPSRPGYKRPAAPIRYPGRPSALSYGPSRPTTRTYQPSRPTIYANHAPFSPRIDKVFDTGVDRHIFGNDFKNSFDLNT